MSEEPLKRRPGRPTPKLDAGRDRVGGEQPYLLVFANESTTPLPLPLTNNIFLGLDEDGTVRLVEEVSRAVQARIMMVEGVAIIENRSSDQCTRVNGEPLGEARLLTSGDVISIGQANIIYNKRQQAPVTPSLLDMPELYQRLRQEIERAIRYQHPFSVLVLRIGEMPREKSRLCGKVCGAVRGVDIVGWNKAGEFVIVLPECGQDAIPTARLLNAVGSISPDVRGGVVQCPTDGTDADTLLTGARVAASGAKPGTVTTLSGASTSFRLDDITIIAVDPKMKHLFSLVRDLARSDIPVLITGETGVGKEIVAKALHAWSPRVGARMVSINCAAVTDSLVESELFGHERGAFSGADFTKPGLLESASGGTIFLDEISESSPRTQAELLRVLDTKRVRRVGSVVERDVDIRVIAATNRSLDQEIKAGRFRQDLYYRLNAANLVVSPLRDRMLDVSVLARLFLEESCLRNNRPRMTISREATLKLLAHDWPGNVRELKHLMENLAATVHAPALQAVHIPEWVGRATTSWLDRQSTAPLQRDENGRAEGGFRKIGDEIKALERKRIAEALAAANGVRVRAAELIGMPLRTFLTKMKAYGLSTGTKDSASD